jgi:hypothetical protein
MTSPPVIAGSSSDVAERYQFASLTPDAGPCQVCHDAQVSGVPVHLVTSLINYICVYSEPAWIVGVPRVDVADVLPAELSANL